MGNDLVDEIIGDTYTKRDVTEASIALYAFVLNRAGALERCHRWLIESGALDGDVPTLGEYEDHLETVLHHLLRDYAEILDLIETAEKTTGPTNARMASAPNCVPLRGEGRHRPARV